MILTYHHIGNGAGDNWVSVDALARQMDSLTNKTVVPIADYDPSNPDHVTITFDDGYDDIKAALPVLKKHGYPFTVFIVGDWFGKSGFVGKRGVRDILRGGGHLGWHTKTHRKLTDLSDDDIKKELTVPEKIRQLDPAGFAAIAYPFWVWDARVKQIAQSNFKSARSGNGHADGTSYALDSLKMCEYTWDGNKVAKFLEFVIPQWPCNFRCHYCYVGQHMTDEQRTHSEPYRYTPEQFAAALDKKRVGGTCILNFCAHGETLINPKTLDYVRAALDAGHFVMIVSNMSVTPHIDRLLAGPADLRNRLFFKCSFHYMELKQKGQLEKFADTVNRVWNAGCSATVEITPSDELVEYIDEIKEFSLKHFGALPHITVARDELKTDIDRLTKYDADEYKKIWSVFGSDLFDFKMGIWGQKRREFCYAGEWGFTTDLCSGAIGRCTGGGYVGNFFDGAPHLPKSPACKQCPSPHCFNGHVWFGLGISPDVQAITYVAMRDRVRADGTHWLTPDWIDVFSQKIHKNNVRYVATMERDLDDRRSGRKKHHSIWWHLVHMKF